MIQYIVKGLIITITLVFIAAVVFSRGHVKEFRDSEGEIIDDSIAEKVFVNINGCGQGMVIKGINKNNPVLLFIHGGPGMPEYFVNRSYDTKLQNYFTVAWWEQRGAGLSYSSDIDKSTMNNDQFVSDVISVTNYLRERFNQDKIYVMAHSWGSFIGLQAVKKAPELYKAYIGVGQITNQTESEKAALKYMIDYYKEIGDKETSEKLKNVKDINSKDYLKIRDKVMHEAGIGTTHEMKSVFKEIFLESLLNNEYTLGEKIDLWRGMIFSSKTELRSVMMSTDIREKIRSIDIPVYFFSGAYDYTVNYKMSKEYLEDLNAPRKEFYLFENSAHSPIFEESDKMEKIIKEDILNN